MREPVAHGSRGGELEVRMLDLHFREGFEQLRCCLADDFNALAHGNERLLVTGEFAELHTCDEACCLLTPCDDVLESL